MLLKKFKDWTKPKSTALAAAAAAAFRQLDQGCLTLAEHIDKATNLCDHVNTQKKPMKDYSEI